MNGSSTATIYFSLSGATMLGFLVATLFFLKFWRRTRDRLFLLFAISFFAMASQRVAVIVLQHMDERTELALYGIRFIAFLVILYAIIDKNRAAGGAGRPSGFRSRPDRGEMDKNSIPPESATTAN